MPHMGLFTKEKPRFTKAGSDTVIMKPLYSSIYEAHK
jgi:hypothetical protein